MQLTVLLAHDANVTACEAWLTKDRADVRAVPSVLKVKAAWKPAPTSMSLSDCIAWSDAPRRPEAREAPLSPQVVGGRLRGAMPPWSSLTLPSTHRSLSNPGAGRVPTRSECRPR